jgi:uncharacterized protein YjiS (DUF1127 family)
MSAFVTNRAAVSGFTGMLGTIVGVMADWNDARATRKALSKLSDRELDDIGLCRGDIDAIATAR